MTDAESTWVTRELAILRAVRDAEERGDDLSTAARAATSDLDDRVYRATLEALNDGCYLEVRILRGGGVIQSTQVVRLLPEGRRAVGQWPSGAFGSELLAELERRLERSTDPEEKSRLRRALDGVGALGKEVLTDVVAKVIEHQVGAG